MTSWTMVEPIVWSRDEDWHRENRQLIEDRRQWRGIDQYLNPLWAIRRRAFFIGGWLALLAALILWGSVSGPRGMIPKSVVELFLILGMLGTVVLFSAWCVTRFYDGLRWRLTHNDGSLVYEASAYWGRVIAAPKSWSEPLDQIARVEVGASVDWKATRPGLLGERPVPREEAQVFLFMADGSRRVIATVYDGRARLSTLAQSIRSSLQVLRERTERGASASVLASEPGEGFRV